MAPGVIADLLAVEGGPRPDIAVLVDPMRNILTAMRGGRIHRRDL